MQIQNITYKPSFNGQKHTQKANAIAVVLLATPICIPAQEKIQRKMSIPDCFVHGTEQTTKKKNYEKIFYEIDSLKIPDNQITSDEVLMAERKLWKNIHNEKLPVIGEYYAEDTFENLSNKYNKQNSDPNTIDLEEYMAIMSDYEKSNKKQQ